jgi:hypothetical protein
MQRREGADVVSVVGVATLLEGPGDFRGACGNDAGGVAELLGGMRHWCRSSRGLLGEGEAMVRGWSWRCWGG